jgi:hypothetical protein
MKSRSEVTVLALVDGLTPVLTYRPRLSSPQQSHTFSLQGRVMLCPLMNR